MKCFEKLLNIETKRHVNKEKVYIVSSKNNGLATNKRKNGITISFT